MAPAPSVDEIERARALVERNFGFSQLRPGQAETIARALRGESVVAILPTGGGKSVCYQLPAMLGKKATLVVSPLLALMKDQLDSLSPAMAAASTSITSELDAREVRARMAEIAAGHYRLVYLAPERLRQPQMLQALRQAGVERLVVDEAHCVSVWGHDFRPDYLALADVRRALGSPPLLAVTATAPPRVLHDIQERLGPLEVVKASVHRPNLRFEAIVAKDADEKLAHLLKICKETEGPGVVYCSSRVKTEQIASLLQKAGLRAEAYHAGLPDRREIQERFMANRTQVLVATIAFGMGVDKPDIRLVVHHDPSGSLEAYYQEAGRAGRDGAPARCVLLATGADGGQLKSRAKSDLPSLDLVGRVWELVLAGRGEDARSILDIEQLDALSEDDVKPRVALSVLEEGKALERLPDAPRFLGWRGREWTLHDAAAELGVAPEAVAFALLERNEHWRPIGRAILVRVTGRPEDAEDVLARYAQRATRGAEQIMAYAKLASCRHAHLRRHFADDAPDRCDACDNCLGVTHAAPATEGPDDEASARVVLEALRSMRGIGEGNLVYMLRGDPLAPPWTDGKPGSGALAFRSGSKVKALVRSLLARGLLAQETLPHGGTTLKLSDKGAAALTDHAPLLAREPERAQAAPLAAGEADLSAALRAWRRAQAEADGVAPSVVLPDKALDEVARTRPRGVGELSAIPGVGALRAETYAGEILPLVARSRQGRVVAPRAAGGGDALARLKEWRRERAAAEGVPAYVVAHDATLAAIVEAMPGSLEALREVKGMGPKKVEKYGDEILRALSSG